MYEDKELKKKLEDYARYYLWWREGAYSENGVLDSEVENVRQKLEKMSDDIEQILNKRTT